MAVDDLPGPVATYLEAIGAPWPYPNEDDIRQFAATVRTFGRAVAQGHEDTTAALADFARAYQGPATRRMQSAWAELSTRHVEELVRGCRLLAEALDAGADVIVAHKTAAIVELSALAAMFEAEAEADAGRRRVEVLEQQIVQHVTDEIVEAAAKPLLARVEEAMTGLDWSQTSGDGADAEGFSIDQEAAAAHLEILRGHAETLRGHADWLRGGLQRLAF